MIFLLPLPLRDLLLSLRLLASLPGRSNSTPSFPPILCPERPPSNFDEPTLTPSYTAASFASLLSTLVILPSFGTARSAVNSIVPLCQIFFPHKIPRDLFCPFHLDISLLPCPRVLAVGVVLPPPGRCDICGTLLFF